MNILFVDSEKNNHLVFKTLFIPELNSSFFRGGTMTCVQDESAVKTPLAFYDLIVSHKGADSAIYYKYRQLKPDNPFVLFLEGDGGPLPLQDNHLYVCPNKNWRRLKEIFKMIQADLSASQDK